MMFGVYKKRFVFFIAIFFMAILGFHTNPELFAKSHAYEDSTRVNAEILQVLSMYTTVADLRLSVTPSELGVFTYGVSGANVTTNAMEGYTLYMSSVSNDTALHHENLTNTIPSVSTDVSAKKDNASSFSINTWGYSLQNNLDKDNIDTVFSPIPELDNLTKINEIKEAINNSVTNVTFGVRVGSNIPSGRYRGTILFTAVPTYIIEEELIPVFYDIATLQEMTPEICDSAITPLPTTTEIDEYGIHFYEDTFVPQIHLTDIRDGSSYKVRKLADGNCWIAEDLKLDLEHGMILDSKDTDLNSVSTYTVHQSDMQYYHDDIKDFTEGNYYGYTIATAGSGRNLGDGEAPDSICPKGWRLPTYNPNNNRQEKSYENLILTYYPDGLQTSIPWMPPIELSLADFETYGYIGSYWTSRATSGNSAFFMSHGFYTATSYVEKSYTFTLRCVSR